MRPHLAATRSNPPDQVQAQPLVSFRLRRQAEDQVHLGDKSIFQSQFAGLLDLYASVPPANAAQDRRAAGLASQAQAPVGAVLDDDLQGGRRDEIRPDLGGKCPEVDGLFQLGQRH